MKIIIKTSQDYKVSKWAGGDTTEFVIEPEGAIYKDNTFKWRVSRANVVDSESTFTSLYGVKRWIMPLDQPLLLKHRQDDQPLYSILVKPYEAHQFKGEWETRSEGKTADFNLMVREDVYGLLRAYDLKVNQDQFVNLIFPEVMHESGIDYYHHLCFGCCCFEGNIILKIGDTKQKLLKGDTLLVKLDLKEKQHFNQIKVLSLSDKKVKLISWVTSYF